MMNRTVRYATSLIGFAFSCFVSAADVKPTISEKPLSVSSSYLLGADDEISIHSLQAKEIADKSYRLDQNGEVNFPMVGVVHLSGCTIREAEAKLGAALKTYYKNPDIAISVTSMHTESVSVLGSVGTPGVYQLKGQVHVLEALSAAGGVRGDAGPVAIITRQSGYGGIPHPDARQKISGESIVEINLKSLMESQNSTENFIVQAHDVISIPAAQLVYVVGHVKKSGGFVLAGRPQLSVLQALALAEGFDGQAAPARAQVLRRNNTSTEQQIPVNMKKILAGKEEDIILRPNDILYVPNSAMKTVTTRTIEAAIQIGTGLAIFHP